MMSQQIGELINRAYLRANSIDAVRGLAYRKGHIREAEELENARATILDLIKEHEEPHWIPVSEGLPKENETVIASTEYGIFPEARYTKEYGWEWAYESGADYWRELPDVTAWMPLPKKYEPQKSEVEK